MSYWFSPSTTSLYDTDVSGTPPKDAIEIAYDLFAKLLRANEEGLRITLDAHGVPVAAPYYDVESGKAILLDSIFRWRKEQETAEQTFEYNGRTWDVGVTSLNRLKPCLELAQRSQVPDGFFWTDSSNNDVPMSAIDLDNLYTAMLAKYVEVGFAIHARQRKMKEDIAAMTKAEEVLAYQIGW